MKKFFIAIMLIVTVKNYGQTLDSIKESSVVYVSFDHKKNQEILPQINIKKEKTGELYYVYFNKNQYEYLIFSHVYSVPESEVNFVDKDFLKENEKVIMNACYLRKFTLSEAVKFFSGKKVFIIDSREKVGKKIKLKQVRVQSSIMHEM